MNIMLIDDDRQSLASLKQILEYYSFDTFAFQKSELALKEFSEKPKDYDIVISDLNMSI